jgi:Flp pilus assembly protein TadG
MFLSRFLADRRAGVAPMFALGLVPIVGMVGAAVDYSRAGGARTAMQAALDATALMIAKDWQTLQPSQITPRATDFFNASFAKTGVQSLQVTATVSNGPTGTTVSTSASGSIATQFMQIMGYRSLNVAVQATVVTASDGLGCVLALNPLVSGAATAQGSTTVTLNGCSLYDNSSNATALTVGGSATVAADFVGVVGGVGSSSGITAVNGIRTGISPVADPYADVSFSPYADCDEQNFTAKSTVTANPGVYCGGISINANAALTLNPGVYYLDGGGLSVNGGATLTGTGVTLVFTSKLRKDWATATINGNATVNLTPPTWGRTAGIVVFADRRIPAGTSFKFNGGATQYLGGAIYVPTGAVTFAGGANTSTSCTQIIGDTVTFVGNSNLAIDCSHYNTRPFSTKVMRVAS